MSTVRRSSSRRSARTRAHDANGLLFDVSDHAVWENVLIRASAGTGKTFQLSNRFLQLMLSGQPVDGILATTFTRKAAGEILDRVMLRLAKAASSEEHCFQLARELDWEFLSPSECRSVLRRVTKNLHRLRVATLDAFFLQATQSLSLELGLPPKWQIIDELEEAQVRDEAIANLLLEVSHSRPHRRARSWQLQVRCRSMLALGTRVPNIPEMFLRTPHRPCCN